MPELVSVVLPTLNGAKYLEHAIQSVLQQTYSHWELIIVDSYSTDETPHIIARYAAQDERIRPMQHPKEQGRLPGALNAGFGGAQGDYFTWLSDDNELVPASLATFVDYLQTHPQVGLVYSHYQIVYEDGSPPKLGQRLPIRYLPGKNIITPSFLYRRAVHEKLGGYRTQYFLAEDYDFWLRTAEYFECHLLDKVLHLYRFHPDNLTATFSRRVQDENVDNLLRDNLAHLRWLQKPIHRARAYYYLYELAQRHDKTAAARRYWREVVKAAPFWLLRHRARAWLTRHKQA
jgi:glycosyltransferase involved in cell wall biosynthesis